MTRTITHLDEGQSLLDHSAAQFFAGLGDDARNPDPGDAGYRPEVFDAMARLGWLGWRVPAALGGSELGFREGRLLHEHAGRAHAREPLLAVGVLATEAVRRGGNAPLRDALLARMAEGRTKVALAWRARGGAVVSRPRAEGVELDGTLEFVCPADADVFVVLAQGRLYRIERARAGVTVETVERVDGGRWAALRLARVAAGAVDLVADDGVACADAALDAARVAASAELFGLSQAGFDQTVEYLKLREQFGVPIGSFQALQHKATDLLGSLELARSAVERAAEVFDASGDARVRACEASAVLARCSTTALDVLKACVQLHGGIGYTDEARIGRYLKRAMLLAVWLGTPAEHRARFGALAQFAGVARGSRERGAGADLGFDPDEVRAFAEREYPDALRRLGRRASWREAHAWHRALHARGWTAPAWPASAGGMGLSAYAQVVWSAQLDRAGVNIVPNIGVVMLGPLLIRHGTPEQRARYLPAILSGDAYWCQGYSEPGAGSDLVSLRTSARLEGDHFVVNGQKTWTSLAFESDMMFLLARTDPSAPKPAGISFLLVDMKTPGITVTRIRNLSGASEFCNVFFDDVKVPAGDIVGPLNGGWKIAKSLLGSERIGLGSPRYVRRALSHLERLARARAAFDDPVFADRFHAHRLDVEDFEALYVRVVEALRRGEDVSAQTSLLKLLNSETWQRISEETLLLAGPDATTAAALDTGDGDAIYPLDDFLVSRPSTIYGGTSEIQRNILAQGWLGLPGTPRR